MSRCGDHLGILMSPTQTAPVRGSLVGAIYMHGYRKGEGESAPVCVDNGRSGEWLCIILRCAFAKSNYAVEFGANCRPRVYGVTTECCEHNTIDEHSLTLLIKYSLRLHNF